jgi:hypothetical protein
MLSRGGGTSLAGQCCNVAVVVDFSKHLHSILELDPIPSRLMRSYETLAKYTPAKNSMPQELKASPEFSKEFAASTPQTSSGEVVSQIMPPFLRRKPGQFT